MKMIRRTAGQAGLLLSILGLLLCLAGVVGVWAARNRVDSVVAAAFTAADDAFDFMSTRLVRVDERLQSSRARVASLSVRVDQLRMAEAADEPEATAGGGSEPAASNGEIESLRELLDAIATELQAAEGWLDSIEAVARGVQAVTDSIAQSRQAAATATSGEANGTEDHWTGATAANVAEFSSEIAEIANRLEALRQKLLEMRENRMVIRELAATMIAEAAQLDVRLARLSLRIDASNGRVSEARLSSAAAEGRAHRWIAWGAVALTLALLWFAASQACVLARAWKMAQRRSRATE